MMESKQGKERDEKDVFQMNLKAIYLVCAWVSTVVFQSQTRLNINTSIKREIIEILSPKTLVSGSGMVKDYIMRLLLQ